MMMLRDKLLQFKLQSPANAEWFATARQEQVVINTWLRQHIHVRPHHALGIRPLVPETLLEKPQISEPD